MAIVCKATSEQTTKLLEHCALERQHQSGEQIQHYQHKHRISTTKHSSEAVMIGACFAGTGPGHL